MGLQGEDWRSQQRAQVQSPHSGEGFPTEEGRRLWRNICTSREDDIHPNCSEHSGQHGPGDRIVGCQNNIPARGARRRNLRAATQRLWGERERESGVSTEEKLVRIETSSTPMVQEIRVLHDGTSVPENTGWSLCVRPYVFWGCARIRNLNFNKVGRGWLAL